MRGHNVELCACRNYGILATMCGAVTHPASMHCQKLQLAVAKMNIYISLKNKPDR